MLAVDDHGDNCGAATAVLTNGTPTAAIIDPVTDEDWFSFTGVAGNRYQATTLVASASFDHRIEVIAPDCTTVLAIWDYYSPDERSVVTPTNDSYYVRIASTGASNVGYIELGLTDQGPAMDDFSGGRAGAAAIPTDGTVVSGITDYVGDIDWLTFAGVGQHLYRMEVRALSTAVNWYERAELYSGINSLGATGLSLSLPGGTDGDWVGLNYYLPAGSDGPLHVRVSGWSDGIGPFEVRVTDLGMLGGDDHGDSCGAATPIIADGSVTSIIIDPTTDEDWLSINCDAGYRYELTTLIPSGTFYPRIELIDVDCVTVLYAWAYPHQNELSFFAPATATYYLRATSDGGTQVGQVSLGVTDRGPQADDHSGRQSGATAALPDGSVNGGTIDYPGDYDYFAFNGLADHLYSVQIRALTHVDSWTAATVLYDGPYQLDFSDGSIGGPGGPGPWSGLVYGTPAGGATTYYVLVYAGVADSGGTYEMTITDLGPTPADDHSDDPALATSLLTDGTPVGGVAGHSGDQDWFRFTADSQRVYAIEVKALISPDNGLVGGSLYAPDAVSYLGFAGWSYGGPALEGDWARVLYYVPSLAAGDYLVNVAGYGFNAGEYQIRVFVGAGVAGDFDGDSIPDGTDNCPTVYNPDQIDSDTDGTGDCCDPDSPDADMDDVADECDNCPAVYNPGQADSDHDGTGDVCESILGDMNCDEVVDELDVPFFVQALLNDVWFGGCDINRADMNSDSRIDGDDIQPFLTLLLGP